MTNQEIASRVSDRLHGDEFAGKVFAVFANSLAEGRGHAPNIQHFEVIRSEKYPSGAISIWIDRETHKQMHPATQCILIDENKNTYYIQGEGIRGNESVLNLSRL